MDRLGESPGVLEVGCLRLHPQQVGERSGSKGLGDGVVDPTLDLVVALRRLWQLRIPDQVDAERIRPVTGFEEGGAAGKCAPFLDGHVDPAALDDTAFEDLRHGLAVRLQAGFRLPDLGVPGFDLVEQAIDRGRVPCGVADPGALLDERHEPDAREPRGRLPGRRVGHREEQVASDLIQAQVMERLQDRQEADPVARQVGVGRPEDERLVPLVGAVVEEGGRLGIGPGDDDARHAHDVELEPCRVEALVLLVLPDQDLAALVTALLGTRLLVLDVIPRDADLDESPDQVPNVRVTPVAGVGVGDDEWAKVDGRCRPALALVHLGACEVLVPVGREEGSDQAGRLVGNLAQRIAREVRTGVLGCRPLRRGGPAAEVDGVDPHPLHHHGLTGGVRAEGRDLATLLEQRAKPRMEPFGSHPGDGGVGLDRALLLDDLARAVQTHDAVEPGGCAPRTRGRDLRLHVVHRRPGGGRGHRRGHSFSWSRRQSPGHSHSAQ